MGTRVYTACGCPGSCQDAVGRLRPCPPLASLLPEACWGSSPAWRHRGLERAEQPSPSTKKLAHPQQGRHRAAAAGAGFFFPMEPRCPELRGLLPTVPTCSVCPDGCPHAPCVPASPSCAKPAWSRPQQPPASARLLKMLLSILPHFLTPLPSLSALGRWDKNSVFLQEGNEGDVASSACQQQSPAFPNRCCAAPAKWSRPAPAIFKHLLQRSQRQLYSLNTHEQELLQVSFEAFARWHPCQRHRFLLSPRQGAPRRHSTFLRRSTKPGAAELLRARQGPPPTRHATPAAPAGGAEATKGLLIGRRAPLRQRKPDHLKPF